jgi:uncharacterized protein
MQEVIKRIILENQDMIGSRQLLPRNYYIPETKHITVLTGIRRCGKTFTLYQIAKKYDIRHVLFLDFEDERLVALSAQSNYDIIVDAYKNIYPDQKPVLFFDEIQNLPNWHLYLKRLHVNGFRIYVTGSNATLISREIATYLKGISLETNIYPFSFKEFLQLKETHFEEKDMAINQPKILNQFEEYLLFGGFPELIMTSQEDKRTVAKNIYNLLFYKDIVAKYDKDPVLLKLVVSKIAENITKDFSITSLAHKIMPVYKASVPTITDYFNILPEPFLTKHIYPYRTSFVQRESRRKTYLADNSFIYLNRVSPDKSRLLENLVFNFLNRKHEEIHYYRSKNQKEVDFYVTDPGSETLVQVCYHFELHDTRTREINALVTAMQELNLDTGYVYTLNASEEVHVDGKTVKVLPVWRVMLERQ